MYADFSARYLGPGADPLTLRPLCLLFSLKYDAEDPTETVRQLFRKIKSRISKVIDLDDTENARLRQKIDGEGSQREEFMQSPYVEVCKDVKSRLFILLEVKPSIEYLNNVTKIDSSKCFSRYGSIKISQTGGLMRSATVAAEPGEASESERSSRQHRLSPRGHEEAKGEAGTPGEVEAEGSQHDDEHDDELADIIDMDQDDDDGEKLLPLGLERSKSQQVGLRQGSKIKTPKVPHLYKGQSSRHTGKLATKAQAHALSDHDSQGDWLEIHRRWKQWNRFHKQAGVAAEDRDLTSPFCSPLHSVLQFAKHSDI